jgi:hypothetical protein
MKWLGGTLSFMKSPWQKHLSSFPVHTPPTPQLSVATSKRKLGGPG